MTVKADIRSAERMSHADLQTTMKYMHYAPRSTDVQLVAAAFATDSPNAAAELPTAAGRGRPIRRTRTNCAGARLVRRDEPDPTRQAQQRKR